MKVKSILVSQPQPETEKSAYFDLAKKHNIKIDFREFTHVEGLPASEFRKEKINLQDFSAVILTSKSAVDHYFRMAIEMRFHVPDTMKYFCINESTAFYIQKYIVYRKRKIFYGSHTINDLLDVIKKHKKEKFLLPCSDITTNEIPDVLDLNKIDYARAMFYKTVSSDLSDLADVNYDVLVFFSPAAITSLFKNFPDFKQNKTRIAAFGTSTCNAVTEAGLDLDIQAPVTEAPSMTMALEQYIKKVNK